MKFMKLGSKHDQFKTDGDNVRYVATELATDLVISVGDTKFYLHKFPLLSKSSRLQRLVYGRSGEYDDEINIHDIPGGAGAFEICAKFCYGMIVTLNAHNVVAARCAAEYLEMYETVEKGNITYKIDVFLTSTIFRSWKDSIIVLQTVKSFLPWSEELKIISHCLDAIAVKASIDPSKVDWSYTYNRKKKISENGNDAQWNGVKKQPTVPKDWWVEDLCELQIDLYKRVITTIIANGTFTADIIGESLKSYALRKLPCFSKGTTQGGDLEKYKYLIETIISLLPAEKSCVPCSFLLKLLEASIILECGETVRRELIERIGQKLDEATVGDILWQSTTGETTLYSIDLVHEMVEQFVMQEHSAQNHSIEDHKFREMCVGFTSDASKIKVAKLVDGYLAEAAKDSSLPLSKFIELAEMVSSFQRSSHDGIYRAIDMYLKERSGLTKSEKKRICSLMDCSKLSANARAHAVQNERLPLRVVMQVLFFEQAKASGSGGGSARALLPGTSYGSSSSTTTNTSDDWDGNQTSEELKTLKSGLESLSLKSKGGGETDAKANAEKVADKKAKKIFSRLWSNKDRKGENSSSDTSESPGSTSVEETTSTSSLTKMQSS
ncbi:phototropic-responsive NPH3 family protein NPY4 isoform X1 [Primulina eburnea]|uniref:phototropic-responsive NPH3 family protein NPY4 isoform X1 n=1 Tax=Primulina eburnea TaxID=1245227 RepID=UPI003C6C72CE